MIRALVVIAMSTAVARADEPAPPVLPALGPAIAALRGAHDLAIAEGLVCGVRDGRVVCAGARSRDAMKRLGRLRDVVKMRFHGEGCVVDRSGALECFALDAHPGCHHSATLFEPARVKIDRPVAWVNVRDDSTCAEFRDYVAACWSVAPQSPADCKLDWWTTRDNEEAISRVRAKRFDCALAPAGASADDHFAAAGKLGTHGVVGCWTLSKDQTKLSAISKLALDQPVDELAVGLADTICVRLHDGTVRCSGQL